MSNIKRAFIEENSLVVTRPEWDVKVTNQIPAPDWVSNLELTEQAREEDEAIPTKAKRYNKGKPRPTLVEPLAIEGLTAVLEMGAVKYGRNNWRKGLVASEILDSLLRHVNQLVKGETHDQESGLPHIDHIGANWMFYSYFQKTGKFVPEVEE